MTNFYIIHFSEGWPNVHKERIWSLPQSHCLCMTTGYKSGTGTTFAYVLPRVSIDCQAHIVVYMSVNTSGKHVRAMYTPVYHTFI